MLPTLPLEIQQKQPPTFRDVFPFGGEFGQMESWIKDDPLEDVSLTEWACMSFKMHKHLTGPLKNTNNFLAYKDTNTLEMNILNPQSHGPGGWFFHDVPSKNRYTVIQKGEPTNCSGRSGLVPRYTPASTAQMS